MHNSLLWPVKSPTTWSFYNLSDPFLQMTPEPWEEGSNIDALQRLELYRLVFSAS